MDCKTFEALGKGDLIRYESEGSARVVLMNERGRVTTVHTIQCGPETCEHWELVAKALYTDRSPVSAEG